MKPKKYVGVYSGGKLNGKWRELAAPLSESVHEYSDEEGRQHKEHYTRVMHHGSFMFYEHSKSFVKYVPNEYWKRYFELDQYDREVDDGRVTQVECRVRIDEKISG